MLQKLKTEQEIYNTVLSRNITLCRGTILAEKLCLKN